MRISAWILAVVWLLPLRASAEEHVVGTLGSVNRIDFVGATVFTAEDLRDGLTADLDFLASAQPHAPRDEFLTTLAGQVREGHRHHGFPEAEATAEISENGERVLVRVTEGPRYRSGQVLVRGGRTVDHARIERAFTHPWFTKEIIPVSTLTAEGVKTRWEYSSGIAATPQPAVWFPGELLPAASYDLKKYHDQAKGALAEQGFLFSHFRVFLHPAPQALAATLVVEIDDEGPPFVFGGVAIHGTTRDSVADVTKFLGLKRGQRLDFRIEHELVHKLWASGRYRDIHTTVRMPSVPTHSALGISGKDSVDWKQALATPPKTYDPLVRDLAASSFAATTPGEAAGSSKQTGKEKPGDTSTTQTSDHSESPGDRPVSVVLHIQLTDAGELPALGEELSPSDRAMLNFCSWLRRCPGEGEPDLVFAGHAQRWGAIELELYRSRRGSISVPVPSPDFHWRADVVLSAGNRQFARVRNWFGKEGSHFDQAAIIGPDCIDWRLPLQKSRLQLPLGDQRAFVFNLRLMERPPTARIAGDPSPAMIDYKFRGARVGRPFAPTTPGLHPTLSIDPPAALLYLRSTGVTSSVIDGVLRVAGPNLALETDADSGRLLRGQFTTRDGTVVVAMWTEHGALSKAIEDLDEQVGTFIDRFDPDDCWGSICECLRWEFSPLGVFAEKPIWPAAAAALRIARRCDPQRFLDVLNLFDGVDRPFSIPGPDESFNWPPVGARRGGDAAALFLKYLSGSDNLRVLAVDAVLQRTRAGRYVTREIPTIARGTASGPLTRFAALMAMPEHQAGIRRQAAIRQKSALTRNAILKELGQLDENDVLPGSELAQFVEVLGEMSEAECQALAAQFFSPDLATAIGSALAPLRRDRTRPVEELLPEVFDRLWSEGLQQELARRLDDWAPESKAVTAGSTNELGPSHPVVPASFDRTTPADDEFFTDDIPESSDTEDLSIDDPLELPPVPSDAP